MKKNDGFTLTELLAVIVILFIIMSIATVSYQGIRNAILEQESANLKSLIEIKAEEYANSNYKNIITVQDLIDNGFLDTDDDGYIIDPFTGEVLNCYYIEIKIENGNYVTSFGEYVGEADGECNSYEGNDDLTITAKAIESNNSVKSGVWTNSDLILSPGYPVYLDESVYGHVDVTHSWSANGNTLDTKTFDLNINSGTSLETTVRLEFKYYDDFGLPVILTSTYDAKIDKQGPTLDYDMPVSGVWLSSYDFILTAIDFGGSGTAGFTVLQGDKTCGTDVSSYDSKSKYTIIENGYYTLCGIDNVGNVSRKVIEFNYIDSLPPVINDVDYGKDDGWDTSKKVIISAVDVPTGGNSGIGGYAVVESSKSCDDATFTLSNEFVINENGTYKICVIDNAGNITDGSYKITISNIDNIVPTVTKVTDNTNTWVNANYKFTISANDGQTKIVKYCVSTSSTKPSSSSSCFTSVTSSSMSISQSVTVSSNATYYVFVMDEANNVSDASTLNYIKVELIDKIAPSVSGVFSNSGTWTQTKDLSLSSSSDSDSGIYGYTFVSVTDPSGCPTAKSSYSTSVSKLTFSTITSIKACVIDNALNVGYKTFTSSLIDSTPPTVSGSDNGDGRMKITLSDSDSGIAGYIVNTSASTSVTANSSWISTSSSTVYYEPSSNTTYYVYAIDTAGNISEYKDITMTSVVIPFKITRIAFDGDNPVYCSSSSIQIKYGSVVISTTYDGEFSDLSGRYALSTATNINNVPASAWATRHNVDSESSDCDNKHYFYVELTTPSGEVAQSSTTNSDFYCECSSGSSGGSSSGSDSNSGSTGGSTEEENQVSSSCGGTAARGTVFYSNGKRYCVSASSSVASYSDDSNQQPSNNTECQMAKDYMVERFPNDAYYYSGLTYVWVKFDVNDSTCCSYHTDEYLGGGSMYAMTYEQQVTYGVYEALSKIGWPCRIVRKPTCSSGTLSSDYYYCN